MEGWSEELRAKLFPNPAMSLKELKANKNK